MNGFFSCPPVMVSMFRIPVCCALSLSPSDCVDLFLSVSTSPFSRWGQTGRCSQGAALYDAADSSG